MKKRIKMNFLKTGTPFFLIAPCLIWGPCFLIISFFNNPLQACGPYHEWETIKEKIDISYASRPVEDAAYGVWMHISDIIDKKKINIALISLEIDQDLRELDKDNKINWIRVFNDFESGLKNAAAMMENKNLAKQHPSMSRVTIADSDDIFVKMGEKGLHVDNLFNPACMKDFGKHTGIDAFLYVTLTEANILHRKAIDRQPGVKDVLGGFIVETATMRAKLVNAHTGMIDWIDELRARYEEMIIYKIVPRPDKPEFSPIFNTDSGWVEVYEYISENTFKPGSVSLITHEGDKITDYVKTRVKESFKNELK